MSQEPLPPATEKSPREYPLLPLRNTLCFPEMVLPLSIGRKRSLEAVESAAGSDGLIFVAAQLEPATEDPTPDQLYPVGTLCKVLKLIRLGADNVSVVMQGVQRARAVAFNNSGTHTRAVIEPIAELPVAGMESEALAKNLAGQFERYVALSPNLANEVAEVVARLSDPGRIADLIAFHLPLELKLKQEILEEPLHLARLKKVTEALIRELQVMELGSKINSEVMDKMSRQQREYFLREQMKAIQKELGDEDEPAEEILELKKKVKKAHMPREARKAAEREVKRLAKMHPSASEYMVSRTYLDWLISLPWAKTTTDVIDIPAAQSILNDDHHGLDKVKDRILEFLSVKKLNPGMKGPILCLVGPPGVGKTSLGKSIARSMGREFVRISLGGIRDEAEIRGHRRTYVGALPGRILQAVKKSGKRNPVMLLDEIDKLGTDFRGDPSSALLEVLDPEQNKSFSDHYLEVEFDLSQVLFIATGNTTATIPGPLLDRMEVIQLPGYTEEEKIHIATQFLVPRQLTANGLKSGQVEFAPAAMAKLITEYTREAGLRNLEREIGSICRKLARKIAEGAGGPFAVSPETVEALLGPQKYYNDAAERLDRPGVAVGMAWTPSGGDILFIEATQMPGRGQLILTGQLGEVMKESAQAAFSYLKSEYERLGLKKQQFAQNDIHIHVPAGAIPKDGPSAGVTMATALASLLTGRKVRSDLSMTGEITLRGKVRAVGGVKEKVLAAQRAGISEIILPRRNEKDLLDLPASTKALKFHFADEINDVLNLALEGGLPRVKLAEPVAPLASPVSTPAH
jgi:ATP-dependent Lon protease